jgi:zinc transporter, ZIP family
MTANALIAALWGVLAASSLLIGALLALWLRPSTRIIGLIMGFGAGALISALAYELIEEAIMANAPVALGMAVGAVVYFGGDWLVDRRGGQGRKNIAGGDSSGSGEAIFIGTLLDGIPESFVLGAGLALGESVGLAFLIAVFISNLPEAMAATASLQSAGRTRSGILMMWLWLVLGSAIGAAVGYITILMVPSADGAFAQAFAGGAMLTMLADAMMPEAFEHGGPVVGLITTLGFAVATAFSFAG